MHSTVQAHMAMRLVVSSELSFRVLVDMEYHGGDPFAVRFTFHLPGDEPVTWVFARELLVDGLGLASGEGDVHIHPVGEDLAEVGLVLRSPEGDARMRAEAAPLLAFLARTDLVVPLGQETTGGDLDQELASILSTTGHENAG
ncbi:SsgA family sporulation/cell division regulator [Kitasatospora sp. NPDC059673]|uniref:SsgA family sporulation/cell division regulator n=1 Tax=Kitasatospora sp. NPDC059673 TaxID=3346901 RepID=UPI0036941DB4